MILREIKVQWLYDHEYHDYLSQVKNFEQIIQEKSSEQRFQNISVEHFKIASEMLIFLITPIDGEFMKSWLKFSVNLFQTKSATEIVLTLNRMVKSNIEKDNIADVNQKLLRKVALPYFL